MLKSYSKDHTFKLNQPFIRDSVFDYSEIKLNSPQAVFYEFDTSHAGASGFSMVPSGCVDVIFITGSAGQIMEFKGSPTDACKRVRSFGNSHYFGVRLKPGCYLSYQSLPLREITDSEISFNAGDSPMLRSFFAKLERCFSLEQKADLFYNVFQPSADGGTHGDITQRMLCEINSSKGGLQIIKLAESMNYSERHISRIFQNSMGMSPKNFARIVRFQNAMEDLLASHGDQLSYCISDLGYSDQAHFQREFKQYSGITPKTFTDYFFR